MDTNNNLLDGLLDSPSGEEKTRAAKVAIGRTKADFGTPQKLAADIFKVVTKGVKGGIETPAMIHAVLKKEPPDGKPLASGETAMAVAFLDFAEKEQKQAVMWATGQGFKQSGLEIKHLVFVSEAWLTVIDIKTKTSEKVEVLVLVKSLGPKNLAMDAYKIIRRKGSPARLQGIIKELKEAGAIPQSSLLDAFWQGYKGQPMGSLSITTRKTTENEFRNK